WVAARGDLLERPQAQLWVAVALHRGQQEAALELATAVEMEHRFRAAPAVGCHVAPGERRPDVLLAVVEVLHRDPPQLALEHLRAAIGIWCHRQHPPLHSYPPAAAAADRADHDRAAAVDVAIEQRMERHDRVVVLGRGMDEVHDDPRLLAGMAP